MLTVMVTGSFAVEQETFILDGEHAADSQKTETNISRERQQFITGLITEYIRAGENVDDPDVKNTIYNDIKKVMPLKPLGKAKISSYHQISQQTARILGEKYKTSEMEVRTNARKEAEKKYQLTPLRTEIQVKYRRGPFAYKYRGMFYARNVKDIQIDDLYVPYIDMEHECRIGLDVRYNQKVRDEYVERQIRDHAREMA